VIRAAALALAMAAGTAHAGGLNAGDDWTGPDKDKHAVLGAVAGFAVTSATGAVWKGIAAGFVLGAAKEYADSRNRAKHSASYKDLIVTGMGAALGAGASRIVVNYGAGVTSIQYGTEF
jgi:uncharacterized protein YfiM (DUF2279 family)